MINFSDYELFTFPDQLAGELQQQSDRGLAVLGSAGLEFLLEQLLRARILDRSDTSQLFGGSGAFSTFSARIAAVFAMGLISRDEHGDLQTIRKIRNRLTHSVADASLDTQQNRDLCQKLVLCERLFAPKVIPFAVLPNGQRGVPLDPTDFPLLSAEELQLPDSTNPRVRFAESIHALARALTARVTATERATMPQEFEFPEEPLALSLERLIGSRETLAAKREELEQRIESERARLAKEGRALPAELLVPIDRDDDRMANRQLDLFIAMARYCNDVVRLSRESHRSNVPNTADG
ncbi:hypothetical protein [Agromyces badenianii]|uniref:hypothetical protein n=1 Tax=Agromyces badenianii TaxID=2080742 RepID=UPI0011B21A16|nr:hypothetical protein [Agromyces badenianii]